MVRWSAAALGARLSLLLGLILGHWCRGSLFDIPVSDQAGNNVYALGKVTLKVEYQPERTRPASVTVTLEDGMRTVALLSGVTVQGHVPVVRRHRDRNLAVVILQDPVDASRDAYAVVFRTDLAATVDARRWMQNELGNGKRIEVEHRISQPDLLEYVTFSTLDLAGNRIGATQEAPLRSKLAFLPDTVDFGTLEDGSGAMVERSTTLTNHGPAAVSLDLTLPTDVRLSRGGSTVRIEPSSALAVALQFSQKSTRVGSYSLPVQAKSLGAEAPAVLKCSVRIAAAPMLDAPQSLVIEGEVAGYGAAPVRPIVVRNSGGGTLEIASIRPPQHPGFQFAQPSAFPISLRGGETLTLNVAFAPTALPAGDVGDTLALLWNASGKPTQERRIPVIGHVPRGRLTAKPTPIDFGEIETGYRAARRIRVQNDGDRAIETIDWEVLAPNLFFSLSKDLSHPGPGAGTQSTGRLSAAGGAQDLRLVADAVSNPSGKYGAQIQIRYRVHPADVERTESVALSASVVAVIPTDAVLVLDRSGSMRDAGFYGTKSAAMRIGAGWLLGLLRTNVQDRAAIVGFDDQPPTVIASLQPVDDLSQRRLLDAVRSTPELEPRGGTAICGGLREANALLQGAQPNRPQNVFLVTDGVDNAEILDSGKLVSLHAGNCPYPSRNTVNVHALLIGTEMQIDSALIEKAFGGRGLVHRSTLDSVDAMFDAEKFFVQAFHRMVGHQTVTDPVVTLAPHTEHTEEFSVTESDTSLTVAVFFKDGILPVKLVAPTGVTIPGSPAGPLPQRWMTNNHGALLRIDLSQGWHGAQVGTWKLVVIHDGTVCRQTGGDPGAWDCVLHPRDIPFAYSVHVRSNLRMSSSLSAGPHLPGYPISLRAQLDEEDIPVLGATIVATVTCPDGRRGEVLLVDDGQHGDEERGDGIYGATYSGTQQSGGYDFYFRATGRTHLGAPFSREAQQAGFVLAGTPVANPDGADPGTLEYVDDIDSNGLLDGWEYFYFGRLLDEAEGAQDLDGDGLSNQDEYRGNTDPTAFTDSKPVLTVWRGTEGLVLSWASARYGLSASTNLQTWTAFVPSGTNRVTIPMSDAHRYFRLE